MLPTHGQGSRHEQVTNPDVVTKLTAEHNRNDVCVEPLVVCIPLQATTLSGQLPYRLVAISREWCSRESTQHATFFRLQQTGWSTP